METKLIDLCGVMLRDCAADVERLVVVELKLRLLMLRLLRRSKAC